MPLSGGRYLITIAGTSLEAVAPMGLAIGTELALRVDQLTPTPTFRMLSSGQNGDSDFLQILRTHLPNYVAAADAVQALRQGWRHVAAQLPGLAALPHTAKLYDFLNQLLPEGESPSAEQLAAYIRDGGQLYEAKLFQQGAEQPAALRGVAEQDVKGLLLGALQELEMASERSTTEALRLGIRKHLDHIESQQALHLLANRHDEPFPLQIPVWLGQAFSTLMLTVDHDGEGKHDGESRADGGYHVLFLLDLDGLGQTRIEAQATAQALRVVFYLEQQDALPVLRQEIPALETILLGLGFPEVVIEARPFAGLSPEKRQTFDKCVTVPLGVNLIDMKV